MKNVFVIITLFMLASCANESNTTAAQVGYEIAGKFSNTTGGFPVYLDKLSFNGNQSLDTAIVANDGSFSLKGTIPQKGLYMVRASQDKSWILIVDKGKISLSADYNDVFNYSASGTENAILVKFVNDVGKTRASLQEYQNGYMQAQMFGDNATMQSLEAKYNEAVTTYNNTIKNMADTTKATLVGLFAATMLNMEQNAPFIEAYAQKIKTQLPDNPLADEFIARVNNETKIAIGKLAPDFQLKTPKGETISLSDTKGKVVLLDFWASWCRPCRMENPNVVRLYEEYKSKGFTVFSVSLDNNMQKWVGAIEQDNLTWQYHGSNLLGWQCPIAQQYKVTSIPQTLLIDKNGTIIGKNLRGIELETKLKEIF